MTIETKLFDNKIVFFIYKKITIENAPYELKNNIHTIKSMETYYSFLSRYFEEFITLKGEVRTSQKGNKIFRCSEKGNKILVIERQEIYSNTKLSLPEFWWGEEIIDDVYEKVYLIDNELHKINEGDEIPTNNELSIRYFSNGEIFCIKREEKLKIIKKFNNIEDFYKYEKSHLGNIQIIYTCNPLKFNYSKNWVKELYSFVLTQLSIYKKISKLSWERPDGVILSLEQGGNKKEKIEARLMGQKILPSLIKTYNKEKNLKINKVEYCQKGTFKINHWILKNKGTSNRWEISTNDWGWIDSPELMLRKVNKIIDYIHGDTYIVKKQGYCYSEESYPKNIIPEEPKGLLNVHTMCAFMGYEE